MKVKTLKYLLTVLLVAQVALSHTHSDNGSIIETEEEDDDITILNRLNFLDVDILDNVYFDLTKHFYYNGKLRPKWHISNTYADKISIVVKQEPSPVLGQDPVFKSYLEINMQDLYDHLKAEHEKHQGGFDPDHNKEFKGLFASTISLSYSDFKKNPETGIFEASGYSLSQKLMGMISNTRNGNFVLPEHFKHLNYRSGSNPLLPYSYRNILNADLTIRHLESERKCVGYGVYQERLKAGTWTGDNIENVCEKVGKFVPEPMEDEETEEKKEGKYIYNFRKIPSEKLGVIVRSTTFGEFHQWSNLMQEEPLHWKLHRNNYMVYITDSMDYPIARVFKIDKESTKLKLIKQIKLA
jgi:hypothetical protein